jgi:hypothetical protein
VIEMATQNTSLSGAPPARMSLNAVVTGRRAQPMRVLLYGVEGVGKSSFAAGAPAPIFLGAEDGTAELDVTRLPNAQDWQDVLDGLHVLQTEKHPYQTLVVDTLDWAEPMLWKFICKRDGKDNIEDYGYGKGYVAALDEWRFFLQRLDGLRGRGMHVVLLAHSWIKPFANPEGDNFDRYELKLNNKAAGLLKEWTDCVLFANYETFAKRNDKKQIKGLSTGARFIYTERRAAYDAKNRYRLPPMLPLSWDEFATAAAKIHSVPSAAEQDAALEKLEAAARAELAKLIEQLPADRRERAAAALAAAGTDPVAVAVVSNRVNATLDLIERQKEAI